MLKVGAKTKQYAWDAPRIVIGGRQFNGALLEGTWRYIVSDTESEWQVKFKLTLMVERSTEGVFSNQMSAPWSYRSVWGSGWWSHDHILYRTLTLVELIDPPHRTK